MEINHTIRNIIFMVSACLVPLLTACNKDSEILPSPVIEIQSVTATGLSDFKAIFNIDLGEGQRINRAKIIFDDITLLSVPDTEIEIPLTGERLQKDSITYQIEEVNHDFAVRAVLETEKYQYFSNEVVVRSIKNNFRVYMLMNDMYGNAWEGIANCYNKGERFSVFVLFDHQFTPNSVEVKLNKSIPLIDDVEFFSELVFSSEGIETMGGMALPETIEAGIYSVDLYIDGHEFECEQSLKVLDGQWGVIDASYTGDPRGNYASFKIGNEVFVAGGNYYAMMLDYSPVWKYNLQAMQWTHLANFPHPGDPSLCEVYTFDLMYNNSGYIVTSYADSVFLWRYDQGNDTWAKVTDYPGAGDGMTVGFIGGSRLFMGGGYDPDNDRAFDFWSYDLVSNEWERLNDLPKNAGGGGFFEACNYQNSAFLFAYHELWEYSIDNDIWSIKAEFPGQLRYGFNLAINGDKLYLIGGMYPEYRSFGLMDCWEYSISSDTWELRAFLPDYFAQGIAFNHQGKIIAGLGYVIHSYWTIENNKLYQLDL